MEVKLWEKAVLFLVFIIITIFHIWRYKKKGRTYMIKAVSISRKRYPNFAEAMFYFWLFVYICIDVWMATDIFKILLGR